MSGSTPPRRLTAPDPPTSKFEWLSGSRRMSHEEFRPAPMTHYQQRAAPYPPSSSTRSPPSSFDARYRHLEAYLPAHVPSYPYASHSPSFYNAPADSLLPSPQAYCPPSASSTYLASPPPTPEAFSSSWSSPTSSYLSDFGGQTYAGSSGAGDWHQGGGSGEELTAPMGRFAAPGEGHIEEPYPQRSPKVMPYRAGVTPFAAKLYWMLEHPADYGEIAKWAETGNAFLIATENTTFVNQILPDLFTHRSITSFLRQLHLYSFERLATGAQHEAQGNFSQTLESTDGNGWRAFQHPYMRRDDPSQLRLLKPKPSKARAAKKLAAARHSSEE